ncbi:MAG: hypothetical protein M3Y84_10095, partial [Acidobacteriota bacterium]|nr:hypothetical protein [Acidobacteriota bacterium]
MRGERTTVVFLALLALLSAACGKSPEEARRKLAEKGLAVSDEAFIKSVRDGDLDTTTLFLNAGISPE